MSRPVIIGCTGGIGSGKTNVVRTFESLGIPGYDCDTRAKELYDEDAELLAEVARIAGDDVIVEGRLDRSRLAARIFSDRDMLSALESVVHPAVIRDFSRWLQEQNTKLVIFESAILLDKPYLREIADFLLLVTAPREVRIARVMARDGLSREAVEGRMAHQMSDEQRSRMADYTIETNDRDAILPQLLSIIQKWQQI
ncbi:MAG: dephospho-CoA kinase [Bacteroidales bacterium]|nr:dephospho-CoA kinase [Bacteroidales bacterium]MBP5316528.1 dephospho-CoA kinase [Bacteroidales bacterium]